MGNSVDRNGINTGVTENDFIQTLGSRVPIVCRFHITVEPFPEVGNFIQQDTGVCPGFVLAVGAHKTLALAKVSKTEVDLLLQFLSDRFHEIANAFGSILRLQGILAEISGVQQGQQGIQDVGQHLFRRQGDRVQVVQAYIFPTVRVQNRVLDLL